MSEKLEYADFLESGAYVKKLEETYNRYLDVRDKKLVEFMKENKRLHSIIKEVREYIEENTNSDSFTTLTSGKTTDIEYCLVAFEDILEILDKESKV